MKRIVELTVDTLRAEHLADLRLLHANPRFPLQPQRRKVFVRLGLIRPAEPPRAPREGRGNPPRRAHVLTLLGEQQIEAAPEPKVDPLRRVPHTGYLSERAQARGGR